MLNRFDLAGNREARGFKIYFETHSSRSFFLDCAPDRCSGSYAFGLREPAGEATFTRTPPRELKARRDRIFSSFSLVRNPVRQLRRVEESPIPSVDVLAVHKLLYRSCDSPGRECLHLAGRLKNGNGSRAFEPEPRPPRLVWNLDKTRTDHEQNAAIFDAVKLLLRILSY